MPYTTNADLPDRIKGHLPEHAQTIFREAFNNAHKQYGNDEQAFKVAWAAVEKKYKKDEKGKWITK